MDHYLIPEDIVKLLYLRGDLPRHEAYKIKKRLETNPDFKSEMIGFENSIIECNLNVGSGLLAIEKALAKYKQKRMIEYIFGLKVSAKTEGWEHEFSASLDQDLRNYLLGVEKRELLSEKLRREEFETDNIKLRNKQEVLTSQKKTLEEYKNALEVKCGMLEAEMFKLKKPQRPLRKRYMSRKFQACFENGNKIAIMARYTEANGNRRKFFNKVSTPQGQGIQYPTYNEVSHTLGKNQKIIPVKVVIGQTTVAKCQLVLPSMVEAGVVKIADGRMVSPFNINDNVKLSEGRVIMVTDGPGKHDSKMPSANHGVNLAEQESHNIHRNRRKHFPHQDSKCRTACDYGDLPPREPFLSRLESES